MNVGRAADRSPCRGREVQTGIFKVPVEGRVAVGELGLEGDVQADRRVHGGEDQAVYAYAIEDVEWWESELGRELGPGFFGENLTLRGVDVNERSAGRSVEGGRRDARGHVPAPAVPEDGDEGRRPEVREALRQGGRPGMYLRVVGAGELAAGDPVSRR